MRRKENNGSSDERKKRGLWQRIKPTVKKWVMFILNPRLLLCFGIAWFITNGWSYIALWLGIHLELTWLAAIGGAYLGVLWIPFTPEKILTVIIAFGILKLLFPKDEKTLAIIESEFRQLKKKRNQGRVRKKATRRDTSSSKME